MRVCWFDTETTHLDKRKGRIIEIAATITDVDLTPTGKVFETKIALPPNYLEGMVEEDADNTRQALAKNGYNDAEWAGAPEETRELWERFRDFSEGCTMAGQNIMAFDLPWVEYRMGLFDVSPTWSTRRFIDTEPDCIRLAEILNVRYESGVKTCSLGYVYRALGGPPVRAHRAMADVGMAQHVYGAVYKASLACFPQRLPPPTSLPSLDVGFDANGAPAITLPPSP